MSYQFIHIETYAKVPSKTNKKQSIFGVAKEAERVPEACPHVVNPLPPHIFGKSPSQIVDMALKLASNSTDSMGRKIRKDGQILLAGVASYPVKMEDLKNADQGVKDHFKQWLLLTVDFLNAEYGEQFKGHVVHLDEEYPHVHFYVLPKSCDDGFLHIRSVHSGMSARDTVNEKEKGSGKARASLYKEAMRGYQDRYYDHVGKPCGLARTGPKRDRLTRKEWKQEQERMKRIAREYKDSNDMNSKFDELNSLLDSKTSTIENKIFELDSKIIEAKESTAKAAEFEKKAIQAEKSAELAKSLAIKEQEEAAIIKSEGLFSGFSSTIKFFKKKAAEFESKYNNLKKRFFKLEKTSNDQADQIRDLKSKIGKKDSEIRSLEFKNNDLSEINQTQNGALKRLREQIKYGVHVSHNSSLDA